MSSPPSSVQSLCPLCVRPPRFRQLARDGSSNVHVDCERCGRFSISEEALEFLSPENRYVLSAACRVWTGERPPLILTTNIRQLVQGVPKFTIAEKLDRLLDLVAQRTESLGAFSSFVPETDYPLLVARSPGEVHYMIPDLVTQKYLERDNGGHIRITIFGMQRLDQIRRSGRESSLCFVAMWFDSSTNQLYDDAIRPAIRDAGYEPLRIDRHEHVNRIDDEIVGQIKRSRFMVADFTGRRHGVYFEAGLMMGLGRSVIWLCDQRELQANGLHFDVRQYNFIDWTSLEDARTRLRNRILAIEGEGPRNSNSTGASS